MSFQSPKTVIEENDTVILYLSVNNMHAIDVSPKIKNKKGEFVEYVFQTTFGALKVESLIGKEYGSKVDLSKGWAYVLQPTPELWTLTLPHRTQIIYTPDISMILLQLEVEPGKIIIESGTGSGSLSHGFIRALMPSGHLHTFDFHELRAQQAREEFKAHGIGESVSVYHRDVCANGFTEELNEKADAVFLDLPAPWLAVPHAAKALKLSGLALKCWRCSSDARGAEFCKDPFDDSIVTEKQREWSYVQCNEPVSADQISHGIVAACKKLVQRVHGQLVVKRSCSLEKEDADKHDCSRPTKFSFIQTISCETCRVDGCNGAIEEEEEEEAPQAPLIDPELEDQEEDEAEDENDEFNDDNEDEEEGQTNDDNEQEEIHSQKENLVRRTEDVVPNDSDLEVEASEKRSSKGNSGESIKLNFVVGGFVLLLALQH